MFTSVEMEVEMNVRWRFRAAAVFAVCALFSLAAAGVAGSAPRVTPPAGSPDLSQMALLPSDFTSPFTRLICFVSGPLFLVRTAS